MTLSRTEEKQAIRLADQLADQLWLAAEMSVAKAMTLSRTQITLAGHGPEFVEFVMSHVSDMYWRTGEYALDGDGE